MKRVGMFALLAVLVLVVSLGFVSAESFNWNISSSAIGITGDSPTTITVLNPDGAGGPHLTGNDACTKNGYTTCHNVISGILGDHEDHYTPLDYACDRVFADGRHDRPVLKVSCSNTATQTRRSSDSGIGDILLADGAKDLGGFSVSYSGSGTISSPQHSLSDNSSKIITWFSTGGIISTSSSATIKACLDSDSDSECDYLDKDNDGYNYTEDCNDNNASINPAATEVCDGVDNDCDGGIDLDINGGTLCVGDWANANFETFVSGDYVDLNDYVRLVVGSSLWTGRQIDYEIWEVDGGLFWIDSKVADISGVDVSWKANVSSDKGYYFTAFVDGTDIGTSNILKVDNTPDDSQMMLKIESPLCGDDLFLGDDTGIYIKVLDEDDIIDAVLNIEDFEIDLTNSNDFIDYTFDAAGNISIGLTGVNSRGYTKRNYSNVMVVDEAVYGIYLAACIDKPTDFSEVSERQIEFEAYNTRAIEYDPVIGSIVNLTSRNDKSALGFRWTFSDIDSATNDFRVRDVEGSNPRAYDFIREFFEVGNNWATLEVRIL
jgi:hypothetical protein